MLWLLFQQRTTKELGREIESGVTRMLWPCIDWFQSSGSPETDATGIQIKQKVNRYDV